MAERVNRALLNDDAAPQFAVCGEDAASKRLLPMCHRVTGDPSRPH